MLRKQVLLYKIKVQIRNNKQVERFEGNSGALNWDLAFENYKGKNGARRSMWRKSRKLLAY